MPREHVRFSGSQGVDLVGRLEGPEGEPVAYALFAHCFTCSKDLRSAGVICRELTARGFAVLRFDFTGIGESEGEFAETNFSSNVEDLIAAADFLRSQRRAPALLVGHSLGGTAMLAAAARIPEAVAVATIGAPSDTRHLHRKLAERLGANGAATRAGVAVVGAGAATAAGTATAGGTAIAAGGAGGPGSPGLAGTPERLEGAAEEDDDGVELDLGGPRPVRVRRQLLADLAADHLRNVLAHLGKGLLIFHSPVDRVVGIDNAERLFLEARHPKSFVSLGGADHLLSDPRDAAHVGAVLGAWAERYLPAGADAADHGRPGSHIRVASAATGGAATALGETGSRRQENDAASDGSASDGPASAEPALPHGVVEVTGLPHSLRQEVRVGTHHLVADEPVADGGTDAGPTPYGLLLAALGACTSMTLRLYAERKKVPLGEVRVRLRHVREHARDCETCAENNTRIERIERDLELAGALTEEQRARLLEIADRCPVHRTLTSQVQIVTRLR